MRSPNQALGAILVMTLTFFIGNIIFFIALASQITLVFVESQPNVIAFLKDEATDPEVEELKSLLTSTGAVKNITYVSKEEALRIYHNLTKDDPILQEYVTASTLPASLRVSATDPTKLDVFRDILSKERAVESVTYPKDIKDKITAWSNGIRTFGVGVIVFLILTSTIITLIVISLNISTYKDEIEIMRLVGATSSYIRIPFILEGILYGLVSAILSTLVFWLVILYFTPPLRDFFQNIPVLPIQLKIIGLLLVTEIALGLLIGITAALGATRKYLKV
jgi:cell division transport system permease protein